MKEISTRERIPGMRLLTVGHRIHVWCASLRHPPEAEASLRLALSPDERARCARLQASRDRRRYSSGRGILRLVLSRYTGTPPRELAFAYGDAGKPFLADRGAPPDGGPPACGPAKGAPPSGALVKGAPANGSRLHFNVSHSGDLLLIAVDNRAPVGIDVERVRTIPHMDSIARRWLSSKQYRAIRRAPTENDRAELFFAGWTSAEAEAKATGEGLLGGRRDRALPGGGHGRPGVSCIVFRPEPGFIAAVAADESLR